MSFLNVKGFVLKEFKTLNLYFRSKAYYRSDQNLRIPFILRHRLKSHQISEQNLIFVDTENHSLNGKSDIIQLAAISLPNHQNRNECINFYCESSLKTKDNSKRVANSDQKLNTLDSHKTPIRTVPISEALEKFIEFIKRNRNDSHLSKSILSAHNAFCDSKAIVNALIRNKMFDEFNEEVYGFIDTLQLFRKLYPNLNSYSQPNLVSYFLKGQYRAHNARDDSHLLLQLYLKALSPIVCKNREFLSKASFDMKYAFIRYEQNLKIQTNISTFEPLMQKKLINRSFAKKLAENGLNITQLKTVLLEKGIQSLNEVLTDIFGKKINKNYYRNIIRYLSFI